jgi:Tfp pilus assembly protein FimT
MELVIVLVLIGLVSGVAAPTISRLLDSMNFRQQTAEVMKMLRYARLTAIGKGRPVAVMLEPGSDTLRFSGGVQAEEQLNLGKEGQVRFQPPVIYFFPEGTATPSTIYSRKGNKEQVLSMDPLTGLPVLREEG